DHCQHGNDALLNAVDQHTLHRRHIFQQSRHEIAGGAIVEPTKRQELNVRIEIAAQVENHALLESVVQHEPQRVQSILKQGGKHCEQRQRHQFLGMMVVNDHVKNLLRDKRKHDKH